VFETVSGEVAAQLQVMSDGLLDTLEAKSKQPEGEG
jgi:hypothetical protein